ncbi:MAG TPA: hypothetical protein VFF86_08990, partial [Candidatus Methylomirabilis sp.]|nr:hypothetical protein [Candidatus Methylomirabilis sp.]
MTVPREAFRQLEADAAGCSGYEDASRAKRGVGRMRGRIADARHLPRQDVCEHPLVVTIPVALEPLLGVVLALLYQKLDEPRVARRDLFTRGPVMVGQVVTPPVWDRPIDEAAEVAGRFLERIRIVRRMQVEDDAGVSLLRPGQEALIVLLDE